jgi:hypothetical protein
MVKLIGPSVGPFDNIDNIFWGHVWAHLFMLTIYFLLVVGPSAKVARWAHVGLSILVYLNMVSSCVMGSLSLRLRSELCTSLSTVAKMAMGRMEKIVSYATDEERTKNLKKPKSH